ncbi:hypothetical protein [Neisseria sp. 83E34]|uniref:hypothetical protein n=1 Tax=Neisseria sp. 83E34 TaxID=1692264 RepID=UPI0006CE7C56|nr:hypothetical protein [Neisseria sp. 83E34]KPN70569.1 hypothetical protein AKG09_11490 [Neisseria sp. 83E34]
MKVSDLKFEDFETEITIPEETNEITLVISDGLDSAYELLSREFKDRIVNFINNSASWYPIAHERINQEFSSSIDSKLLSVYILSEMSDSTLIFGLEYHIEEDREHGRGIKITENMEIIEYGLGDVAIC